MEETIAQQIAEYASSVMSNRISDADAEMIKMRVVDSIIVSYAAMGAKPIKLIKEALLPSRGRYNSRVYFTGERASVDTAAFINGGMTRYHDYNDTYLSKEALHPSDNIPPVLCLADSMNKDGISAIKAIKVAYQVVCALADAASIRDRGWDHVTYVSASAAAGAAALMGLGKEKFVSAINLAVDSNISLRQTRVGELSMWKGLSAANAARNGVFAAMLAKGGVTGPSPIFEGEMGFIRQVSGKLSLSLRPDRVGRTMIKNFPVEYHAMSAAEAALMLKSRIRGRIRKVEAETFSVAYNIIGRGAEKINPRTKETADHSLQYIIAYTLLHGAPNTGMYSSRYINDAEMRRVMRCTSLKVSKRFDSMYPEKTPARISVAAENGAFSEQVDVPKGHFLNPYTWNDIERKGKAIIKYKEMLEKIMDAGSGMDKKPVRLLFDVMDDVTS